MLLRVFYVGAVSGEVFREIASGARPWRGERRQESYIHIKHRHLSHSQDHQERKQILKFAFDSFVVVCTILSSYPSLETCPRLLLPKGISYALNLFKEKGVHAVRRPEKWERIEVIYGQNPSRNPVCSIIHCWMSRWCVIEWLLKASQKCREWHRN